MVEFTKLTTFSNFPHMFLHPKNHTQSIFEQDLNLVNWWSGNWKWSAHESRKNRFIWPKNIQKKTLELGKHTIFGRGWGGQPDPRKKSECWSLFHILPPPWAKFKQPAVTFCLLIKIVWPWQWVKLLMLNHPIKLCSGAKWCYLALWSNDSALWCAWKAWQGTPKGGTLANPLFCYRALPSND